MYVGTVEQLKAFMRTCQWGTQWDLGHYCYTLDNETEWSLALQTPGEQDEAVVYALHDSRAALLGMGKTSDVMELVGLGDKDNLTFGPGSTSPSDLRYIAAALRRSEQSGVLNWR